jgi:hypothetical protein
MDDWPAIDPAELQARLLQSDEEFFAFLTAMTTSVPPRSFTDEIYTRALGYPWARPASSFVLTGETVKSLDAVAVPELQALMDDRWPLLAFGSNGAPEALTLKFGHLAAEQQRLLVTAGDLHGFDVGASAHPTIYGSMPGTIFPSAGTVVRASVLWVTTAQLVALTWTEMSYALGRLDGIRFDADEAHIPPLDHVLAFVSRLGAHRVEGELIALDAVPARRRAARAVTQEQLLDEIARRVIGPAAASRDLVLWLMEDFGGAAAVIAPVLHETALPFASPHWTPYG